MEENVLQVAHWKTNLFYLGENQPKFHSFVSYTESVSLIGEQLWNTLKVKLIPFKKAVINVTTQMLLKVRKAIKI